MRRRSFSLLTLFVLLVGTFGHYATWRGLGVVLVLYGIAWDIDLWRARRMKGRTK